MLSGRAESEPAIYNEQAHVGVRRTASDYYESVLSDSFNAKGRKVFTGKELKRYWRNER